MDRDEKRIEYDTAEKPSGGAAVRKAALVLLTLIVVLGVAVAAVYFDMNSFDSITRLFNYNKVEQDEEGKAVMYEYSSDRSNVFAMLDERLIVASQTRLDLLDNKGESVCTQPIKMKTPTISVGKKMAAVYDAGGTELYLLTSRGLSKTMTTAEGEEYICVRLNESDYMAVTTLKSRYKAAVSVYNANGELVFTFDSAKNYVADALVLPDNRLLAQIALGQEDNAFRSELVIYRLDSEEPYASCVLGEDLSYCVDGSETAITVLSENAMSFCDRQAQTVNTYSFDELYLRGCSKGSDFTVLLFDRYRAGNASTLVTLDSAGAVIARQDCNEEIIDISACGKYIAALFGDTLRIYTKELEGCAILDNTDYAHRALMRSDGTALVIGSSTAWLFIP